jgi:hypothetical protein
MKKISELIIKEWRAFKKEYEEQKSRQNKTRLK